MSRNRNTAILALTLLASMLASTALAQSYRIGDLQLFRPYDDSTYAGQPQPSIGFYFGMDYVALNMSQPRQATLGADITRQVYILPQTLVSEADFANSTVPQTTTLNTGGFGANWHSGLRTDIGYIAEDGGGWNLTALVVHGKSSTITALGPVVNFNDPNNLDTAVIGVFDPAAPPGTLPTAQFVALPQQFDNLLVKYTTRVLSTDVQRTWRTEGGSLGGWLDWGLGFRYFANNDSFTFIGSGGSLDQTNILQTARNNIFGPQFSLRWFTMSDRWTYSADLRLVPGLNSQAVYQSSVIASNSTGTGTGGGAIGQLTAQYLLPTGSNSRFYATEFSPVVDFRINVAYRVTDYINVRAGGTLIYVDGIARSPDMINYDIPRLSINGANNKQGELMYGFTFGVEINR